MATTRKKTTKKARKKARKKVSPRKRKAPSAAEKKASASKKKTKRIAAGGHLPDNVQTGQKRKRVVKRRAKNPPPKANTIKQKVRATDIPEGWPLNAGVFAKDPSEITSPGPYGAISIDPEVAGMNTGQGTRLSKSGDSYQFLRWSAGLYYCTDIRGCSIEQLHKHPAYNKVPVQTLYRWSVDDKWTDRRKQNLENWRKAIEAKLGNEVVRAQAAALLRVRNLFERMLSMLEDEKTCPAPRSFEGLVNATVRVALLMNEWSQDQIRMILPDVSQVTATVSEIEDQVIKPHLSKDEAREAAMAVLKMRRSESRRKLGIQDKLDVSEDIPEDG